MATYKKQLHDRINAQWLARVKAHDAELRVGTVRVHLMLTNAGKVRDLYVLPAGANGRLKRLVADAINHTDIHHHRSWRDRKNLVLILPSVCYSTDLTNR